MKIRFLATGAAPEKYEFDGEKVIFDSETFDLSLFKDGDEFMGINHETQAIRDVKRIDGELYVTLTQQAPPGHWRGVDEYIDSKDYNSDTLYIKEAQHE